MWDAVRRRTSWLSGSGAGPGSGDGGAAAPDDGTWGGPGPAPQWPLRLTGRTPHGTEVTLRPLTVDDEAVFHAVRQCLLGKPSGRGLRRSISRTINAA